MNMFTSDEKIPSFTLRLTKDGVHKNDKQIWRKKVEAKFS